MLVSFADRDTADLYTTLHSRRWKAIERIALRKLFQLDTAIDLTDLRTPPSNRLEPLSGDRAGQHSIRVNEQWRVCFRWLNGDAYDVEIVDYH